MKHLVVDISAHGFGHIAQTSAVLNALDVSNLRLTIRSAAAESVLRGRIRHPFTLIPWKQDEGVVMFDAMRANIPATFAWYQQFHAEYAQHRQAATAALAALEPDVLFANVPYLSLDAAADLGVPSVAMCSLNWADVFWAYCHALPEAGKIHADILNAYSRASVFLTPTPSMDMHPAIPTQRIAPMAQIGQRVPDVLRAKAQRPDHTRFVLVALGGLDIVYPMANWPALPDVCWIFPDSALHGITRTDCLPLSLFSGLSHVDVMTSCDVVLTKTGYGAQTEAVINQVPALCLARPGWPEEPNLPAWHAQHGEVIFSDWAALERGDIATAIHALLDMPWQKPPVLPTGASEAATILQEYLRCQ
ncbi:MAG: hypothetical protein RI964_2744 [Pseudomonadota bacterium]|jgi:hypothetical protein